MNISKEKIDDLNVILSVDIVEDDYKDEVTKTLKEYRKKANIRGFRKGQVPMSVLKKQYGREIIIDQVIKLLKGAISNFLTEEESNVIGRPILKENDEFSWDANDFTFKFEVGIRPEFDLDLKSIKVNYYKIEVEDEFIEEKIRREQIIHHDYSSEEIIDKESYRDIILYGFFVNEKDQISEEVSFFTDHLTEENIEKFIGLEKNSEVELNAKNLFKESTKSKRILLDAYGDNLDDLGIKINFNIKEIIKLKKIDSNNNFFNKLYPDDSVKNTFDLKKKVKEKIEGLYKKVADKRLYYEIIETLIENISLGLPIDFLKRCSQYYLVEELKPEKEVGVEHKDLEREICLDLIKMKVIEDQKIKKANPDELRNYTMEIIKDKQQSVFYSTNKQSKEWLENLTKEILLNKKKSYIIETKIIQDKILSYFKTQVNLLPKDITFSEFSKLTQKDKVESSIN
ncbi:MAG: trigger factor [Tenacibaculum sp.]